MSREAPETRTRILEAAWRLLEAGGGSAVRMSDIAKQAGISRQALYLHFKTRVDLLIATTRYLDEVKGVDQRLARSREAPTGSLRLQAYIEAWGNYIPEIHGVARALIAVQDTDEAAALAWLSRMAAVRDGCEAAIAALDADNALNPDYSRKEAADVLSTLLSVANWQHLTITCGWSQSRYVTGLQTMARTLLEKSQ